MKRKFNVIILIGVIGVILFIIYDYNKSSQNEKNSVIDEQVVNNDGEEVIDEEGKEVQYGAGVGNMVYDYELVDIQTGDIVKISDFRGKKVLMNFWASWCPPCKAEAPHLQAFHEEQDDVVILGINVQSSERREGAEFDFVEEYGLTFDNVYAPDELYHVFPINSFPTSILVNTDGIIEEGVIGPLDLEMLRSRFDEIE